MGRSAVIYVLISFILALSPSCKNPPTIEEGVLSIAFNGSPTNIDPRYATDAYSHQLIELCYNGLVRKKKDGTTSLDLAASIVTLSPKRILVKLKMGVHFHDGSELTSDDVIYTYRYLKDKKNGSPHMETFRVIRTLKKLGDYSLSIELEEPFAPFLTALTMPIIKKGTPERELKERDNGTGPFLISSFSADDSAVLLPFRNYFRGTPRIKKVKIRIIPDDNVRFLEIEKGEVNFAINGVDPDLLSPLKKMKNLAIEEAPGSNFSYIGFNLEDPILSRRDVREAIAHGINREEIIDKILRGQAIPGNSLIAPMYWAHEKKVALYSYNPSLSKELLDRAGFPDPDGPGGKPRFEITYKTSQNELRRRIAQVVQEQLRQVGIGVKIRSYEWGTFFNDIKGGNFQMYSLTWVGITDPDIYFYAFHSKSLPPVGANRNRYKNTSLDSLLEEGRKELDPGKRKAIYSRVQQIVARDIPIVGLWFNKNILVRDKRIKGFTLFPDESLRPLENCWIEGK
jgi:peptide/nickel transport system substrate-binding protein